MRMPGFLPRQGAAEPDPQDAREVLLADALNKAIDAGVRDLDDEGKPVRRCSPP